MSKTTSFVRDPGRSVTGDCLGSVALMAGQIKDPVHSSLSCPFCAPLFPFPLQSWTEPAAKHLVQATKVDFGQQEPFFATLGRDPRRDLLSLPVLFLVHCLFSCVIVMLDLKPFCSWLLCLQKEEPGNRTGDWMGGSGLSASSADI